jgi:type I restriction enzyme S subunit
MIWPTKKLVEVCQIVRSGITPFEGEKEYIDTNSLQNFSIVKSTPITYKNRPSRANMEAKADDVLVAKMADTLKVYLVTPQDENKRIFSTGFFVLRPKKGLIEPKYLFLYCASNLFQDLKNELARGSTQKALNDEKLKKYFEIPLPPLEIQKRIVARIEELFEKIDKAKELRVKALEETEEIFQSALQEIFDKADKKWRFAKIGNIASDFQSGFACSERATKDTGIPQLRPNNIGFNGEIDLSDLVFIPLKLAGKNKNKYDLKKGDVLFNNTNSKELVGRASLVKRDLKCVFSNHITRIRVNPRILFPEWLVVNINYLWKIGYFLKISQKWIGQAGINTQMLKSIEIPLPPLSEQKRIVAYLDNLREKVEKLKKIQQEQLKDLEELKKSILEKAFKGELII